MIARCTLALWLAACAAPNGPTAARTSIVEPDASEPTIGPAERPARLVLPDAHDGVSARPAIVLLHGYTASGAEQERYFHMARAARAAGVYLVVPDGTVDRGGERFWNATRFCCDFGRTAVDDVAYLTALLDALEARVPVDRGAIFFVGHSNGGFMSYRMACEAADRVAAIVSLAGSDAPNDDECVPSRPVSVLQIHGDRDEVIAYRGERRGRYPGAVAVVRRWAARAGCDLNGSEPGEARDLEPRLAGAETEVQRYSRGCAAGTEAELWTIRRGRHISALTSRFADDVIAWLLAHARR